MRLVQVMTKSGIAASGGLARAALAMLFIAGVPALLSMASPVHAQPVQDQRAAGADAPPVLRVCQDPNNLPFSNRALQGFENKIAALLAADLGWGIDYTWYPQRMGFIRNTLRARDAQSGAFKCDLVTGVAAGFDMGATTRPYYRSSYAMAYVKGKGLDGVQSLDDLLALPAARRASLRLGVFGGSPVADWLLEHGLIEAMVSYQAQSGDPAHYPGEMVEKDLARGAIDIAFIWGPIAGYFARQAQGAPISVITLQPQPGMQFDFDIVMATRFGEAAYKERIDAAIERNRGKIDAILAAYGVPVLPQHRRSAAFTGK